MAEHTSGPWRADFHNESREGGRFVTMIHGDNNLVPIAAVPSGVEGYGREEGRSNARLIAAAPELLAALVNLVDSFEKHRPKELWDDARKAIAKATGR